MTQRIRFRRPIYFVYLLLILALLSIASERIYRWRMTQWMLSQKAAAQRAELLGRWDLAETILRECLIYEANDPELCFRIGLAIRHGARDAVDQQRAIVFLARSVRIAPENLAYRLALADAMLVSDPLTAMRHAESILADHPNEKHAERVRVVAKGMVLTGSEASLEEMESVWTHLLNLQQNCPKNVQFANHVTKFANENWTRLTRIPNLDATQILDSLFSVWDRTVDSADDESNARFERMRFMSRHPHVDPDNPRLWEDFRFLDEVALKFPEFETVAAGWHTRRAFVESPTKSTDREHSDEAAIQAIGLLQRGMEKYPDASAIRLSIAQLHWWTGDADSAYQALLDSDCESDAGSIISLRLAETAIATGRWDRASATLRDLLHGGGQSQRDEVAYAACCLLAQCHLSARNPTADVNAAWDALDQAEELGGPSKLRKLHHHLKGVAYVQEGQWRNAFKQFEKVGGADRYHRSSIGIAYCLFELGDYQQAVARYRQILKVSRPGAPVDRESLMVEIARCELAIQCNRPPGDRHWDEFEKTIETIASDESGNLELCFLRARAIYHGWTSSRYGSEANYLADVQVQYGESSRFWGFLAQHQMSCRRPGQSLAAIERHEEITQQEASEIRFALAGINGDVETQLRLIDAFIQKAGSWEKRRLVIRKAQLLRSSHGRDLAIRWLRQNRSDGTITDVDAEYWMAQFAWQDSDLDAFFQAMKFFESPEHCETLEACMVKGQYLCLRSINQEEVDQETGFSIGRELAEAGTPESQLLAASIFEGLGRVRDAISSLRTFTTQHSGSPEIELRLCGLLLKDNRSSEAIGVCVRGYERHRSLDFACLAANLSRTSLQKPHRHPSVQIMFEDALTRDDDPKLPLLLMNLSILESGKHDGSRGDLAGTPSVGIATRISRIEKQLGMAFGESFEGFGRVNAVDRGIDCECWTNATAHGYQSSCAVKQRKRSASRGNAFRD